MLSTYRCVIFIYRFYITTSNVLFFKSTLQDYEKIPVDAFGLAMLRGMGWQPGKGIGKNEKYEFYFT